jgi:hypothetical protein
MTDFTFLDLTECDKQPMSSPDSWFTEASNSPVPYSPESSSDYDSQSSPDSDSMDPKKTRVKWTTAEDSRLRKLFLRFPEQWETIEQHFGTKSKN